MLIDDITYLVQGRGLAGTGTAFGLPLDDLGRTQLMALAGGRHWLWVWLNGVSVSLFGNSYWAPLTVSIVCFCRAPVIVSRLLVRMGVGAARAANLSLLVLIHPTVVPWTLINVRDTIIFVLVLSTLEAMCRLFDAVTVRTVVGFGVRVLVWVPLRLYVPPVIALAGASAVIFNPLRTLGASVSRARRMGAVVLLLVCLAAAARVGGLTPAEIRQLITGSISRLPLNFVRVVLTPRPWSISEGYGFTTLGAIIKWLTLPIVVMTAWSIRDKMVTTVLVSYLLIFGVTLSLTEEFIGVRQALQIDGILILFQLYALSRVIDRFVADQVVITPSRVLRFERRVLAGPQITVPEVRYPAS